LFPDNNPYFFASPPLSRSFFVVVKGINLPLVVVVHVLFQGFEYPPLDVPRFSDGFLRIVSFATAGATGVSAPCVPGNLFRSEAPAGCLLPFFLLAGFFGLCVWKQTTVLFSSRAFLRAFSLGGRPSDANSYTELSRLFLLTADDFFPSLFLWVQRKVIQNRLRPPLPVFLSAFPLLSPPFSGFGLFFFRGLTQAITPQATPFFDVASASTSCAFEPGICTPRRSP